MRVDPKYFMVGSILTDAPLYFTSLPFGVSLGGNYYISDGGLMSYEPPRHANQLDRAVYKLTFSDLSHDIENRLAGSGMGADMAVHLGFYDYASDLPVVDSFNNMLHVYSGNIDTFFIDDSYEDRVLVVQGASPFAALETVNSVYTNKDSMDRFDKTDSSMDWISSASLEEISLKWGRK